MDNVRVIVCGRLRERTFETREGEKRTSVELAVDEVGMSLRYGAMKVTKTSRTQPEDMAASSSSHQGSDGIDGAAVYWEQGNVMDASVTAEPCPNCGEARGVRWYESSPVGCTTCSYEWAIHVEEAHSRQLVQGTGE